MQSGFGQGIPVWETVSDLLVVMAGGRDDISGGKVSVLGGT